MAKKARFRPAWFADAMVSALAQAGSVTALADKARIPRSSIDSWADGSLPNAEYVERILAFVGGDIRRALPGYEFRVGEDAGAMSVEVLGQVAAGSVTMEGTKRYAVDVSGHAWRASRFWPLTHGQVVFLEVSGDSMTPMYRDGDLLACRAPVDPRNLPDRTPCVFTIRGEGSTFKLLMRARGGYLVAQPLNSAYKAIVFTAEDKPRIDWVVLGQINLGR